MQSTRRSNAERGFTLVEILVASTITLSALATTGLFFTLARKTISDQLLQIETLQGLRAAMDSMTRDLRLGGACLPTTGDFITLDAAHGPPDSIFTRTGLVRPNETCIRTTTTTDTAASATTISVVSANGFAVGMRAYIIQANGTSGEVFTVTGLNTSSNPNTLSKTTNFTCTGTCPSPAYPAASGIYALDERRYAIDTSNSALPVLTLAANGGTAAPFVFGIENMVIQYQLDRNCDKPAVAISGAPEIPATGCDVVTLPASTEFALVNSIYVTITARSRATNSRGQYFRFTRTVAAKPRNLLPGG
ncbi:MAG TPA: prepilin-type N-terminal cleavage/methylation domain-containing protein [Candidatus Binatia bacterium]|nr:prepilin-type N-terminal cleavage/methylation domain-containing protein [Candidatus Binatia bacterium]